MAQLLSLISLIAFCYAAFKTIYNRYFHPLAKFPGPFMGSITDFYFAYMIASVPTYGLHLHKKHGPVVRLAPNLLSFSDPNFLPIVYHRYADKPQFYGSWMFGTTAATFQSLKYQDHAAKKRLVAPCCSMSTMKRDHEEKISVRVDELCRTIIKCSVSESKALDFSQHLRWFLADTWTHLVYGRPTGSVAAGHDHNGLIEALEGVYVFSATAAVMPWLMPWLRKPWLRDHVWCYLKTFKNMTTIFKQFDDNLDRRAVDPTLQKEKLFFDPLYPSKSETGFKYSREDLKAEVITFTAATLDGVAAFICPFIDNMIKHPDVCSRVMAEIDKAEQEGCLTYPVVSFDETTRLPYFLACVKETLRRDAPAQTILPRVVSEPGYLITPNLFIPPGVSIGASPYIIHRDESVFGPNPDRFQPERWIPGEGPTWVTPDFVARMEKLGMWWGYGDRECVGKAYAQMQSQKLLVELLRRFRFRYEAKTKTKFRHERWAVGMFWDMNLVFEER